MKSKSLNRAILVKRISRETAEIKFEMEIGHDLYMDEWAQFEIDEIRNVEIMTFKMNREELYSLAKNALSAASEIIKIERPG